MNELQSGPDSHNLTEEPLDVASFHTDDLCSALANAHSQFDLDCIVSDFLSRVHPSVRPIIEGDVSRALHQPMEERTAAGLNSLYVRNPKLCVMSLSAEELPKCTLTPETLFSHFQKINPTRESEVLKHIPYKPVLHDAAMLITPFTREELALKLSRSKKHSSPGPSGLAYADLNNGPTIEFLHTLFNFVLRTRIIPSFWRKSKLTMVFKSGDKSLASSWRPIAGQETMSKLFTGMLADRLQVFASAHSLLPLWQRATSRSDGCHECNMALDMARDAAKRSRTKLHLVWLDVRNAFGSVNRNLLLSILARYGLPPEFVALIESLYAQNVQLYDDGYFLRIIPEVVGVKQGDPLSALLFSFYLTPVMLAVSSLGKGFRLFGAHTLDIVAFADDMLLFAPSSESMESLLKAAVMALDDMGLKLNVQKCVSLSVSYATSSIVKLADAFTVHGELIPVASTAQTVKYLGRPYGSSFYTDIQSYLDEILALARSIRDCDLFPWYKLQALSVFAYSKLHYLMRVGSMRLMDLYTMDRDLKQVIRTICALPFNSPNAYLESPACCAGLGFPSIAHWLHAHTIAQFANTMNDSTSPVSEMARAGFLAAAKSASLSEALPYVCKRSKLAGASSTHFIGKNHWAALVHAIRAFNSIMEVELVAQDDRVYVKVGLKGSETHVLPTDNLFHHLCLAIHRVTYASLLSSRRGSVFKHLSAHRISLNTLRTGWGLTPHEWQFMHKSRLDIASLPSRPHPGVRPSLCRNCHVYPECINHVLSLCKPRPLIATCRHDMVLWRVVRAILSSLFLSQEEESRILPLIPANRIILDVREGVKIYVNIDVPYTTDRKRPDILFIDENQKFAYIIDVQVVVEDNDIVFQDARKDKILTYTPLREALKRKGFRTCLDAFLMGALGSFDSGNSAIMSWLNLPPLHYHCFVRFLCSQVTKYACDMYHAYLAS